MKKILSTIILLLTIISNANCADNIIMGSTYLQLCENSKNKSDLFCLGYLKGVLDSMLISSVLYNAPFPNIPNEATLYQLNLIVLKYLKDFI